MRPTNEISDPVWQDIWDRDEHIADLTARLAECRRLLREAQGGYGCTADWWLQVSQVLGDDAAKAGGCDE